MSGEQKYRVIKRLEAGGMAEVFVGETVGVQGFKKRVAIKRVLPHLAQNKNFIGMFLDEARLGARLNHANIVTVFDIGAADSTFFIVMEFIDGCNLKKIIDALRTQGRAFPLKEAIYICMEACRGLSYAHELLDDEGNEMDLVHRDVSPPNILVSKRGEVKVMDFGLAKATTQLEKTDPGMVKGKFSYLSPEAALGEEVDARADVFGVAIVLWEMLAGRRLFLGESDLETVKMVQRSVVPSIHRIRPEVGDDFERILNKGLARDPKDRYQSAREFGDALTGFLFSRQLKTTPYDIAGLVKTALEEQESGPRDQQSVIDKLIREELFRFTSLDDMSGSSLDVGGPDVSTVGAIPLDGNLFEDPANWFASDDEVQSALEVATGPESADGWTEAGRDLFDEPEPVAIEPGTPSEPKPEASKTELSNQTSESSGGGAGKFIAVILLLLAIGAAVFFVMQNQ